MSDSDAHLFGETEDVPRGRNLLIDPIPKKRQRADKKNDDEADDDQADDDQADDVGEELGDDSDDESDDEAGGDGETEDEADEADEIDESKAPAAKRKRVGIQGKKVSKKGSKKVSKKKAPKSPNPKPTAAEKRGEARKEAKQRELLRNAERAKLVEYKDQTFAHLPSDIRTRRVRAEEEHLVEYIDVKRVSAVLKQLEAQKANMNLEEPKHKEAEYLHDYCREFVNLLQTNGTLITSLPGTHTGDGKPRQVYINTLKYFSRHGAGRRYTTIERKKIINGRMVKCSMKSKQRDEEGSTSFGEKRNYCLQGCPKVLRAQLSGAFNHDVDMRLAHPTIAVQMRDLLLAEETDAHAIDLLNKAKLDVFQDYVEHRDTPVTGWIDSVCEHHEIEGTPDQKKECIKRLFCRIMFGGSYKKWRETAYGKDKTKKPKNTALKQIIELENELSRLRKAVFVSTRWRKFVQAEHQWTLADAKFKNISVDMHKVERSIFSRLMQTVENDILQIMIERLRELGWSITTLIFDGCHVLHRDDADLREALNQAQRSIKQNTGFDITLLEKDLFGKHLQTVDLRRL